MSVIYVIKFQIVPGRFDDFLALLTGVLDAMRHEPMLYEAWQDHDDVVNVQLHRPYRKAFHEALPTMLAAPRDISIWRRLRADRSSPL